MFDLAAHRRDRTVAFAVALVLLLQAFFTAWAVAAPAAGAMPVDAWGHPLCVISSDDGAAPDGSAPDGNAPDGNLNAPDCCAMGCGGAASVVPTPEGDAEPFRAEPAGSVRTTVADHAPLPSRGHAPGSPRAPPSAA